MQEILRLTLKVALVSALVAGSALAAPQSQDPPSQDPARRRRPYNSRPSSKPAPSQSSRKTR